MRELLLPIALFLVGAVVIGAGIRGYARGVERDVTEQTREALIGAGVVPSFTVDGRDVHVTGREALRDSLLPADEALAGWPACEVAKADADRFSGGQQVPGGGDDTGLARVYAADGRFLGIGERQGDGTVAPKRIFLSEKTSGKDE